MIVIVIAALVLAALIAAFVTDVRDRRSGKRIASAKEIGRAVRDSKRQTRVQMKAMRRGFGSRQQNGQAGRSPGGPYLRSDDGPPRRGR
jgi:hypothetical protein